MGVSASACRGGHQRHALVTVNWTHRTQTVKVTARADTKVGLVYLLLSGAFAALALVGIITPQLFLKATFGDLGAINILVWLYRTPLAV